MYGQPPSPLIRWTPFGWAHESGQHPPTETKVDAAVLLFLMKVYSSAI